MGLRLPLVLAYHELHKYQMFAMQTLLQAPHIYHTQITGSLRNSWQHLHSNRKYEGKNHRNNWLKHLQRTEDYQYHT